MRRLGWPAPSMMLVVRSDAAQDQGTRSSRTRGDGVAREERLSELAEVKREREGVGGLERW